MADLIGEEMINWDTFEVTDPSAPEYVAPQAEPEASVEPPADLDPAPEDTAQQDEGRPRDPETGRFLPREEAQPEQELQLEQEPEQQQEPGEQYDDPILNRFLQKYGGDAEQALKAAAHQTDLIGRQGSEIGELRAQLQELVELTRQGQQQQQQFARSAIDVESVMAQEGMYAAAERTAAVQDWDAHNRVLREWEQMDPDQAGVYKLSKQAQYEAEVARTRAAELERSQKSTVHADAAGTAWARLEREIPNLADLAPLMTEEANEAHRISGGKFSYTTMIESGDPDQAFLAFRTLALAAQARQAGTDEERQRRAGQIARTAAVESQRAKAEALVSSSDATAPDPPPPRSYDDELLAAFQAQDAPFADGWQVGNH